MLLPEANHPLKKDRVYLTPDRGLTDLLEVDRLFGVHIFYPRFVYFDSKCGLGLMNFRAKKIVF